MMMAVKHFKQLRMVCINYEGTVETNIMGKADPGTATLGPSALTAVRVQAGTPPTAQGWASISTCISQNAKSTTHDLKSCRHGLPQFLSTPSTVSKSRVLRAPSLELDSGRVKTLGSWGLRTQLPLAAAQQQLHG